MTTREKAIELIANDLIGEGAEASENLARRTATRIAQTLIFAGLLQEWRPISEARKDGTEYQLWCSGRRYVGSWRVDASIEEDGEPEWLANDHDDWSTGHCSTPLDPTLFMPLPAPPEQG